MGRTPMDCAVQAKGTIDGIRRMRLEQAKGSRKDGAESCCASKLATRPGNCPGSGVDEGRLTGMYKLEDG